MVQKNFIQSFVESFVENIPPALSDCKDVLAEHARQTAESVLDKMGIVSREEFDAQVLLLRRTREKLDQLQASLDQHSRDKAS